jgi:hypothetical protein
MTRTVRSLPVLALLIAVSGCSGTTAAKTRSSASKAPQASASATELTAAVRGAILAHHRLSVRALWSNQIDAHPRVIAGPALADLRTALTQRRKRGVRVRLLSERFRIVSIRLQPSYAAATAVITDPQRLRPYGYDGRPLGRPVSLDENARIQLHRVDRSRTFVVWQVTPIQ